MLLLIDNPRSEDPQAIIQEMLAGVSSDLRSHVAVVVDRRDAICAACRTAADGSLILIAGKGHEKYQEIAGERRPFDDVEFVRAAFASLT